MSAGPNRRTRAFAIAVTTAGIAVTAGVAIQLVQGAAIQPLTPGAGLLVALVLLGELLPVRWLDRGGGVDVTSSWSYAGALVLLGHWQIGLFAIALASATGDVRCGKSPLRVGFNAAQLTLSLAAGAAILHAGGGLTPAPLLRPLTAGVVATLAAAGLAVMLTNAILTATVVALEHTLPPRDFLRQPLGSEQFADAADMALAPLYALTAATSAWLLPLVLVLSWRLQSIVRRQARDEHDAACDRMTGLLNATTFRDRLHTTLSSRHAAPLALALVRVANHDDIVLRHGGVVGDTMLGDLAARLRTFDTAGATIARVDRSVFGVLLPDPGEDKLDETLRRLAATLRDPVQIHGAVLEADIHVGASRYPDDGVDSEQLLDRAGAALHHAAELPGRIHRHCGEGRRRVSWLGSELLVELREAVDGGQLRLVYQPVIDLESGDVIGAEALVRWDHPTRGVIPPDAFIPLAEQTGAITVVTSFVLDQAAAQLARWRDDGRTLHLAVNISACDLVDPVFAEQVVARLDHLDLDHGSLELELTENAMSRDWDISRSVLQRLHEDGVHLAVDDFGTGYSSLVHLMALPFDTIKVDRSFVNHIRESGHAAVIVRTVLDLAKGIGARALAEGIESADIHSELRSLGCDAGQGYLFSAPLGEADFNAWLEDASPALFATA